MRRENTIWVGIIFLIYALIIPAYIYTYKEFSLLFWFFFVAERIMSFMYVEDIEIFLEKDEENDFERNIVYFLVILTLCVTLILGYMLINYPRLFIIIIIGEVLDKCFEKIHSILSAPVNVEHAQYKK